MTKYFRFNIYLLLLLAIACTSGCLSAEKKKKKEATNLSLHMEVNKDTTDRSEPVPVLRGDDRIYVNVEKAPFLDEGGIDEAKIVEDMGSFKIQLRMNSQGKQLLEGATARNPGKRVAILCIYGEESRWLAAPRIARPISDGVFSFTPDATREEAVRIVRGLNNLAEAMKKSDKW